MNLRPIASIYKNNYLEINCLLALAVIALLLHFFAIVPGNHGG